MKNENTRKVMGIVLALLVLTLNFSPFVRNISHIPSEIRVVEGEEHVIDIGFPLNMVVEADKTGALQLNGELLDTKTSMYKMNPLSLQIKGVEDVKLKLKIFGIIPIKTLTIRSVPNIKVIPGGQAIGVTLHTKGALVVGTADVRGMDGKLHNPADDAGIIAGDIIRSVNGINIRNSDHLSEIINDSKNNVIEMDISRNKKDLKVSISPVKDSQDGIYRLGIWVRDSTAGVGTLTFYYPDGKTYGALGHAITDIDTGSLLSVKEGEIMKSRVVSIKQGKRGEPGELKGIFSSNKDTIGSISKNTEFGIYGNVYKEQVETVKGDSLPIMLQSQVREGPAVILCTIDDEGVKEFDIDIVKVNRQPGPSIKGIVIKITDEELLSTTGGIVQGMSGSPILQDNKVVGAVTHVFINDPSKGYGLFIEWMLKESEIVS